MTNSLEELFCQVDDFCQIFEPKWRQLLPQEGSQGEAPQWILY